MITAEEASKAAKLARLKDKCGYSLNKIEKAIERHSKYGLSSIHYEVYSGDNLEALIEHLTENGYTVTEKRRFLTISW